MSSKNISVQQWLWRPFDRVAGGTALAVGLAFIVVSGIINYFSGLHFDGVIDIHFGTRTVLWVYIAEHVLVWLVMAATLTVAALIVAKSRFRIIDLIGTQALARWPVILASIVALPMRGNKIEEYIKWKFLGEGEEVIIPGIDIFLFVLFALVSLGCVIWMVILMYKAYSISCNVKGAKGIVSFIIALIIAEIISLFLLHELYSIINI